MIRALALGLCATLAAACVSPDIAPRVAGQKPVNKSGDEAGLWMQLDSYEKTANNFATHIHSAELDHYVAGIACHIAKDFCEELRVNVMDVPAFNASMAPNGYMEV